MKKVFFLLGLVLTISKLPAQEKGIHFEHNYSWQSILAKAKAENKYIFVDCFTTWCGPCKFMSSTIFPSENTGKFFNEKFINVKFQLDTTIKDDENIKKQYADAAFIKHNYNVVAYPTYLFFNEKGELVHRSIGATSDEAEFITIGKNALDTTKQYYTLLRKYDMGNREPQFLKDLAVLATQNFDEDGRKKYTAAYTVTQTNLLSESNKKFIFETTRDISDTGFTIMLANITQFETVADKIEIQNRIKGMILNAQFTANNHWEKWDYKKWAAYTIKIKKKYPAFAEDLIFRIKTIVFRNKNKWAEYSETVTQYDKSQPLSEYELNEHAWAVFRGSSDIKILEKALLWSKKSFISQSKVEPGYIDTYANILYKVGRKREALQWELKAQKIAIEQGADKSWGQDVIDKMNKGEKTW